MSFRDTEQDWVEVQDRDQIETLFATEETSQVALMQPGFTPVFEDPDMLRLMSGPSEGQRFFILTSGSAGLSAWLAKTRNSFHTYETLRRHGFRAGDRVVGVFQTEEAAVAYAIKLNERRQSSAA